MRVCQNVAVRRYCMYVYKILYTNRYVSPLLQSKVSKRNIPVFSSGYMIYVERIKVTFRHENIKVSRPQVGSFPLSPLFCTG